MLSFTIFMENSVIKRKLVFYFHANKKKDTLLVQLLVWKKVEEYLRFFESRRGVDGGWMPLSISPQLSFFLSAFMTFFLRWLAAFIGNFISGVGQENGQGRQAPICVRLNTVSDSLCVWFKTVKKSG